MSQDISLLVINRQTLQSNETMADIKILAPYILSWEGGYVNIPNDSGGPTNRGVTIATWRIYGYDKNEDGVINTTDVKLITEYDAIYVVMKPGFWDKALADQIQDQSVANIIVDWMWGSGVSKTIKRIQKILGVKQDGIVGPKTLGAINSANSKTLFNKIWTARQNFYCKIVDANPVQKKFLKGWLNRLNGIRYGSLKLNDKKGTVLEF